MSFEDRLIHRIDAAKVREFTLELTQRELQAIDRKLDAHKRLPVRQQDESTFLNLLERRARLAERLK